MIVSIVFRNYIVLVFPPADYLPCLFEIVEPVQVKTFTPELSIEAFNETVLHGLPWINKHMLYMLLIGPYIEGICRGDIKAFFKKKIFGNLLKLLIQLEDKLEEQERKLQEQSARLQEQSTRLQEQGTKINILTDHVGPWQNIPDVLVNDGLIGRKEYLEGYSSEALVQSKDTLCYNIANVFRGSEENISNTVKMFIPYVADSARKNPTLPFIDFGCGRGEFLDALQEEGIYCIGIDVNSVSAQRAIDHGHEIIIGEAVQYLKEQNDYSLAGLSMIMVSEHVDFSSMFDSVFLFSRKIAAGGSLLINTINPYCFERYGNFCLDPSHINFLPPDIYKLIMEMAGFKDIKIIWSAPIRKGVSNQPLHTQYENVTMVGYK